MSPVMTAPVDNSEDTEITLGTGKMLAIFFALVILCATFFGMGYSMGRNSSKSTAELLPSPSTTRTTRFDQPTVSSPSTTAAPADSQTKPPEQQPVPANASATTNPSTTPPTPDQTNPTGQPATGLQPPAGPGYFVQVAAVSKQEDAQALVDSLKGRQYQAFIADQSPDKLFHVQVGPFTDVKDAESMRTRLVNDGYNPILKK